MNGFQEKGASLLNALIANVESGRIISKMSLLRVDLWPNHDVNGEYFDQEVAVYQCDITGDEIPPGNPYFGFGNLHISDNGMDQLIEQWICRYDKWMYPMVLSYLAGRICKRIRPDRYIPKWMKVEVLKKYKHQCNYCGSKKALEFDHIRPVSKKGLNELKNLQILCKPCNLKKKDKLNYIHENATCEKS